MKRTETPWVRVYYIYLRNECKRRCMINQSFWHVWWRLQLLCSLLSVKMLSSSIAPSPSTSLLSLTPLCQQTGPCTVCMCVCVLWVIDLSWWFLCTGEMLGLVLFKYYFDYSAMIISARMLALWVGVGYVLMSFRSVCGCRHCLGGSCKCSVLLISFLILMLLSLCFEGY